MTAHVQPLPALETMIEICSEARDRVREAIRRNPDYRDARWLQDREPRLLAIGTKGERLNDDGWCRWQRRKRDVEALLREYPDAVAIIADGGINVAANREELEAGAYSPEFWQVTLWKRHEPVYSDAQLEEILRRRTGFRSFEDMFRAKSSYRPSIDVRDPEMKAIGDRYDELTSDLQDDRRAYRYGAAMPAATALETVPTDTQQTRQARELEAGDVVLIGTMEDPDNRKTRTVDRARVLFGLNVSIRFTDGTERALRDGEDVQVVAVAPLVEEDGLEASEGPRP